MQPFLLLGNSMDTQLLKALKKIQGTEWLIYLAFFLTCLAIVYYFSAEYRQDAVLLLKIIFPVYFGVYWVYLRRTICPKSGHRFHRYLRLLGFGVNKPITCQSCGLTMHGRKRYPESSGDERHS
jgi:hypothetical protein|tara:strand:+ start:368 stop:739 length:372 start_codon:yes stop_codon:yes gene_type:complete